MNTTNYIRIFRGDDSDALGYQTIVGTIKTDLDLTGCKAVFRFLGFYVEFDPIPEDKKLTIVIPAQASRGFPPGVGYASLKVFDSLGKIRTFTNRILVIVDTMTPSCGCGEFEVSFSPFPELEPLKIFIGPNADDFDQYTGFVSKIIDRASLMKYGLAILADAMSEDGGVSGKAASPLAVKAAYDAIIKELTDNYYNAQQTEEAIDRVAAYYITRNAAGDAFETKEQLDSTTVFYSGGEVRVPTRNDYCVVLADETHYGAEYRYIYAVAEGETTGSWQPQFPVEGVMTIDQSVTKNSTNPVASSGIWATVWGALTETLPTGFSSLYDWIVDRLAPKVARTELFPAWAANTAYTTYSLVVHDNAVYKCTTAHTSGAEWDSTKWAVATGAEVLAILLNYLALSNKPQINGNTLTGNKTSADLSLQPALSAQQLANIAAVSDALAFDATHSYAAGDPVVYDGTLYTFTDAHTGTWTGSDVSAVDIIARLAGKADKPARFFAGNLAKINAHGNPTDSAIPAANVAIKDEIPYDRITITTGQLQDHAKQKVTLNAATTTLSLPALTDLTGKVSDFGIDMVNGYEVSGTPTAASFQLDGTLGTDYNLIVPEGEDWSEMTALAAGEMAVYYFTLSAFQINDKPTWEVMKKVVTLVPVPSAP